MPTFNQKSVIKSYKLRLQEKLKTVIEETEDAHTFLDHCVAEFKNRVQHILEIKNEKCLSLYRELIQDLESYSEKIFILQHSLKGGNEEESASSSEDESAVVALNDQPKPLINLPSQSEKNISQDPSLSVRKKETQKLSENANQSNVNQRHSDENLQRNSERNLNLLTSAEGSQHKTNLAEESLNLKLPSQKNVNISRFLEEKVHYSSYGDDGESIAEDDFHSLHSDSNIQNIAHYALVNSPLHSCDSETVSVNNYDSNTSVSQSSCYRSVSSSISESLLFQKENKTAQILKTDSEAKRDCQSESSEIKEIQSVEFDIESSFSAVLSHIIDPSNFWIQMENSTSFKLKFPKSEYTHLGSLSSIKMGQFCLAPFKTTPFYYRAKSLLDANPGKEAVEVLFIDHGSTQNTFLCDLRPLPASAYEIPAQAINCYLHGIASVNDSWSPASIERFKDFQNFCIDSVIKSKENFYGVQLVAKLSTSLSEDLSFDIAQALCLDNLAISLNDPVSYAASEDQLCVSQLSPPVFNKTDSSLEVSGSYDTNALSNDSGVSVTSTYKSSQISCKRDEIFTKVSEDYCSSVPVKKTDLSHEKDLVGFNHDTKVRDLISFESCDGFDVIKNSKEEIKETDLSTSSVCLLCRNKKFCLHLTVPSPSLLFFEKDMAIVMLSHIVSPHEFYVNMAMENIINLDDLREQMTQTYEADKRVPSLRMKDLSENMFCAGHFDADNHWYRVKILRIYPQGGGKDEVLGQYIDYGNTSIIKCCHLKPLTPEFSKHPCFAVRCSLAGIRPISSDEKTSNWSEDSVRVFKELTSFDRCLTAQICNDSNTNQNDTYSVLLWDTVDSKDVLINESLANRKVAVFEASHLCSLSSKQEAVNSVIDSWDPMLEEYIDSNNSYAVDDEDIEVATTGYQSKDEKYTCKYFALRGHCPRGSNCPYEHLPLLESGLTRDQEEVYCMDTVPIISEATSNTLVQVSAIISPSYFYVILPFGGKTVDNIDDLVSKGSSYDDVINSEAKALFYEMNKHYCNAPFQENTTIALSCGTIVVAKRKWDDKWHRGRVVDVVDINKPAKVFFVDSGDHEWVPRKYIRTILPQFLYTPFQAVQCCLHGIEPVGSEKGSFWSSEALNYFKDVVAGEILLAEIVHRFGQVFQVSLRKTTRTDHKTVAEHLVNAGFARYQRFVQKKPCVDKVLYVPG